MCTCESATVSSKILKLFSISFLKTKNSISTLCNCVTSEIPTMSTGRWTQGGYGICLNKHLLRMPGINVSAQTNTRYLEAWHVQSLSTCTCTFTRYTMSFIHAILETSYVVSFKLCSCILCTKLKCAYKVEVYSSLITVTIATANH